jgi:hypothetical protein
MPSMFLYLVGMSKLYLSIVAFTVFHTCIANSFHHEVNYEHENGELLMLKSKGRFADIIDIDEIDSIKVRMNLFYLNYYYLFCCKDWVSITVFIVVLHWEFIQPFTFQKYLCRECYAAKA